MVDKKPNPALDPRFLSDLGSFFVAWSTSEMLIEIAISEMLRLTHEEAHTVLAGRDYGRKTRLLHSLLKRSDRPKKNEIIHSLNRIQNSKRNILAHSTIGGEEDVVIFLDRNNSGNYVATEHRFTHDEFSDLVNNLLKAGLDFQGSFGIEDSKLAEYGTAALSANLKPTTSPGSPTESA